MIKKIAVPIDEQGIVNAHFGHCPYFKLHDIEGNVVVSDEILQPPPHEPGLLPGWLAGLGVTDVLAGGIGDRAIQLFNQRGISVYAGAPKMEAGELVQGFLDGSVAFTANACDH